MLNDIYFKNVGNCECYIEVGCDAEKKDSLFVSVNQIIFNDYETNDNLKMLKGDVTSQFSKTYNKMSEVLKDIFSDIEMLESDFTDFQFSIENDDKKPFYRLWCKSKNKIDNHDICEKLDNWYCANSNQ